METTTRNTVQTRSRHATIVGERQCINMATYFSTAIPYSAPDWLEMARLPLRNYTKKRSGTNLDFYPGCQISALKSCTRGADMTISTLANFFAFPSWSDGKV